MAVKTDVAVQSKGELISVEEELALEAKTAAALERPIGGAISFRSGVMSWQGNPIAGNRLQCVVLDVIFENRWYLKPFNPEMPANPECFALARKEEELHYHPDSENPQGAPKPTKPGDPEEGMCRGCPKDAWGSDPRPGSRGKACSQIRRMVVLPATALESEKAIKDSEIAIMKIPVTSTRYWAAYVNRLAATVKRPVYSVITEVYTEPHPRHQFHVHFNMMAPIRNELVAALKEKIAMSEPYLLAPYAVSENAEPDPVAQQQAQKPKKY